MAGAGSSTATLYAWAVPAFTSGSPVDHTWVTTYDNRRHVYPNEQAVAAAGEDYWFCWGSFHPVGGVPGNAAGLLGSQSGSLGLARCLVQSNADSNTSPPARGTIFVYGVDGVCHQLANQVLYATGTGGKPLTVRGARGYAASAFVYGTFGLQHAAWASKVASCAGAATAAAAGAAFTGPGQGGAGATMTLKLPDLPDDFESHARAVLDDDPQLLARLLALKGEVHSFTARQTPGFAPPSAPTLNARNQHLIDQAAILLGRERFEKVFGFPPDETIDLVDPAMTR